LHASDHPFVTDFRSSQFALTALLLGAAIIGTSGVFVRLSEAEPIATAFYRIAFSLPFFWLWMRIELRSRPDDPIARPRPRTAADWLWIGLAGVFLAFDLAAMHWSIQFTSIANTVLLANTAPLYVALGAWLILGERITPRFLGVLALTLAGVVLLVWNSLSISLDHALGDGLALLTGVFYGGYQLSIKRLRGRFSASVVMTWTTLPSIAVLALLVPVTGESFTVPSLYGWIILIVLGVFTHAGGQGLINCGVGHLKASFASVALLFQPVVAALIAWAVLSETIAPLQGAGAAIVLAGIFFARRESR
jgi:drug/metabolite transporter (DMT)-like permease